LFSLTLVNQVKTGAVTDESEYFSDLLISFHPSTTCQVLANIKDGNDIILASAMAAFTIKLIRQHNYKMWPGRQIKLTWRKESPLLLILTNKSTTETLSFKGQSS
jgi:hypothetical protein